MLTLACFALQVESLALSQDLPAVTYEVSGTKVAVMGGHQIPSLLHSTSDLKVEASGSGHLSASLDAQINLVIDWGSVPPSRASRCFLVTCSAAREFRCVTSIDWKEDLPNLRCRDQEGDGTCSQFVLVTEPGKKEIRVPFRLKASASGTADGSGSGSSPLSDRGGSSVTAALSIKASPVEQGSWLEKGALAGKVDHLGQPNGRIVLGGDQASSKSLIGPGSDAGWSIPLHLRSQLKAPYLPKAYSGTVYQLETPYPVDSDLLNSDSSFLAHLADAEYGKGWAKPGAKLTLKITALRDGLWFYPVARIGNPQKLDVNQPQQFLQLTDEQTKQLQAMPAADGLPPRVRWRFASPKDASPEPEGKCEILQLLAGRIVSHHTGLLEIWDSQSRLIRQQPVSWRSLKTYPSQKEAILPGMMWTKPGYDDGPFINEDLLQ